LPRRHKILAASDCQIVFSIGVLNEPGVVELEDFGQAEHAAIHFHAAIVKGG